MPTDVQEALKSPEPITREEEQRVVSPADKWTDAYAAKIAYADYLKATEYLNQNHYWRYRNADEIYLAWTGTKYWEGTRVPRSNIPMYVAFEQIESLMPSLMSAIFADYPPFAVDPGNDTTTDEARAALSLMLRQMENPKSALRKVLKTSFKSALTYGNGPVELAWENFERPKLTFQVQHVPIMSSFNHPLVGNIQAFAGTKPRITQKVEKESVNMPILKNIPIQQFFIDPNCSSPSPQDGRYAGDRKLVPIDEITRYRDNPLFKIPSDAVLIEWSKNKTSTQGDQAQNMTEAMRSGTRQVTEDHTADTAGKRIEVIRYVTADRVVWLAGRNTAILNVVNPYGFINFFNSYYVDVINRFQALAVTDIAEGDQRLIASIVNSRMDEVALNLHKPLVRRRGTQYSAGQTRIRPGMNLEAENPKEDYVYLDIPPISQEYYLEVTAAERRVQQYTGVTDVSVMGMGTAGGNSANRTASGINTQAAASSKRIQYLIENIESEFLEPLLYAWWSMNQKFLSPEEIKQLLGQESKIDPIRLKNASLSFTMKASARMQSKQATLQILPIALQSLLNPSFMSTLAQVNQMAVNVKYLGRVLLDACNLRQTDEAFIPLSQQQIAAQSQPPPADMLKSEMQDKRMEAMHETMQEQEAAKSMRELGMHTLETLAEPEGENGNGSKSTKKS